MKGILVSMVCLVFFSVVVDVILPKNTTNKFIKSIFGCMMVLVLIVPIKDFVSSVFSSHDNVSIVYLINQSRVDSMTDSIYLVLSQNGIEGVRVEIDINMYEFDSAVSSVGVYLDDLVLKDNDEHIHISDEILKHIQSILEVDKDKVVFYG